MTQRSERRCRRPQSWWPAATLGAALISAAAIDLAAHDPVKTRVTWTGDIARIVAARCLSCHNAGARDTMSLATYEEARPWARAIKEEVLTRRMPVWHAVRGYGDFSNDPSLSAFDIALVSAWVDGGAPKGTEADAVKANVPQAQPASTLPSGAHDVTMGCGEHPAPAGSLMAVRPTLAKGESVGIAVKMPDRRVEIVGWIRGYDPRSPQTYQLRVPLTVPRGARIIAQPAAPSCSITLTVLTP